jgi:ribosomal protein L37AE/L43A
VAFRPVTDREKTPKCSSCGKGNPSVFGAGRDRHIWLCAVCEYRAAYPNAPTIPAAPYARRALPLQKESLF